MTDSTPAVCPRCQKPLPPFAPQGLCPACVMALNLNDSELEAAPPKAPPPTVEELAPHFPQLEILRCLGRGGMGIVYQARQPQLDRDVALKILAPELVTDARFAERFQREAKALARLSHPHIITIHDFGEAGGYFYLLMEYVDGVNLRQLQAAGRLAPKEALAIVPPICEALQYAHDHGIVHRDIKPENLLVDQKGQVKIADFGIARLIGTADPTGGTMGDSEHTLAGTALGTPAYMAPEQAIAADVDHRADIYSLGVVLYEMLTGELPRESLEAPSRRVQIDVRLDEIVLRALEQNPEQRYQTAGEFGTMVETMTHQSTPVPPPPPEPRVQKRKGHSLRVVVVGERDGRPALDWAGVFTSLLWMISAGVTGACLFGLVVSPWTGGFYSTPVIWGLAVLFPVMALLNGIRLGFNTPVEELESLGSPGSSTEPRLSRTAVVGAVWGIFFFLFAFLMFFVRMPDSGQGYTGPSWWQVALQVTLIPLGISGPFACTILGWVAVAQIRRSAGRLYGLGLALYDGLLFPVLLVDALLVKVMFGVLAVFSPQMAKGPVLAMFVLSIFLILLADGLVIWLIWRGLCGPRREPGSPGRHWRWMVTALFHSILILILSAIAVFQVPKMARMFDEMLAGEPLPALTMLALGVCNFLSHAGIVLIPLALIANLVICWLLNRPHSLWPLRAWSTLVLGGLLGATLLIGTGLYMPYRKLMTSLPAETSHTASPVVEESAQSQVEAQVQAVYREQEAIQEAVQTRKVTWAGIGVLVFLPVLLVVVGGFALWLWMLIDCATHEPPGTDKVVWILIILFLNGLGALIYLLARRPKRRREAAA